MNDHILDTLQQKFTSGNGVPVPSVRLSRGEYDALMTYINEQKEELGELQETLTHAEDYIDQLNER